MGVAQYAEGGLFQPVRIADLLKTTADDLAWAAGLGRDAVRRRDRVKSDKTQRRLREMVEVLAKAAPRFGSELMAYAWYRAEPLPGYAGQTAMQLVKDGRARDVLDYLDAVDAGIHA